MKKTDWIFLATLIIYSYLFWDHDPGLNFLVFNIVLIAGLLLRNKTLIRNKAWAISAMAALVTSTCIFIYCNPLSVIANIFALLMTSSFVLNKENSFFMAMCMAGINTIGSIAFIILEFVNRVSASGNDQARSKGRFKRVTIVVCAVLVALVFFLLYRGSSVVFASFTDQINLDFISVGWCIFMFIGSLLLFSFYKQFDMQPVSGWDRNRVKNLLPKERTSALDKMMSLESEYFAGMVLFGILNVMLLVVNALDVAYLFGGSSFLPKDVTYSEYVHQGIQALILSILFATMLILFWFRNFHEKAKQYSSLKWLALLWVVQNIVMIAITIHRNHSYIFVYGLTFKRIGVDFYLFLALIGLLLVIRKVLRQESNSQFLHRFGWTCFATVVLACPVNWDSIVFNYNVQLKRPLDISYINSLSDRLLPEQQEYALKHNLNHDDLNLLSRSTLHFLQDQRQQMENNEWQSMCVGNRQAYDQLMALDRVVNDSIIEMHYWDRQHVYYFPCYRHAKKIIVSGVGLLDLGEIPMYTETEHLDLSYNPQLSSIDGLEKCNKIEYLDLRGTSVEDYNVLLKLPHLDTLFVDDISAETEEALRLKNRFIEIKL